MLYGWRDRNRVFVGAADTLEELVRFYDSCPSVGELPLIDPILGNAALFAIIVRYYEFPSGSRADDFVQRMPVSLMGRDEIARRQADLVRRHGQHPGLTRELSLGETLGFVDYTAAFAADSDEVSKQALDQAKSIRKAEHEVETFGRIVVEDGREQLARSKQLDPKTTNYYRIVVPATLETIERGWTNEDRTYAEMANGYGQQNQSTWFAFSLRSVAARFRNRMIANGFDPSGLEQVGERPTQSAPCYLFAQIANGVPLDQTWIAIVPDSHLLAHGELSPSGLDIDHLLPADFKQIRPGIYLCPRRWSEVERELIRKKFQTSMAMNVLANRL